MESNSYKRKINWLLILQGWAMLWVIIGHSFLGNIDAGPVWSSRLVKFAYSFHMPLFMLVSGWLFFRTRLYNKMQNNGWTYSKILKDKALRLLYPGLVFSLIAFILKMLFPNDVARLPGIDIADIIHQYLYPYDNPMRELWFIVTLFWFFFITPIWEFILKDRMTMWWALPVLILLHFLHPKTELLCIGRFFDYAIYFYLGILMCKTGVVDKIFNMNLRNSCLTLMGGIIIYGVGSIVNPFITTLGGILLSFGLSLVLDRFLPQLFSSFRNYTYQIIAVR